MTKAPNKSGKAVPTSPADADLELGNRINTAIERIGSLVKAGEIAGVTDEAVARWRDGRSRPPFSGIVALCIHSGLSVNWMATGVEPRDSDSESSHVLVRTEQEQESAVHHLDPRQLDSGRMVMLPVLDVQASAGTGLVAHQENISAFVAFSESYLRELGVNPRYAHILQISGRSMWPTLDDRDWVVVDRSIDAVIDEALYAVVYGGMVLVKRVRLARDGTVTLSSDNKTDGYEDEKIAAVDLHTLQVVGRVRAHCRALS